jgi:hypothetical protein
MLSNVHNYFFKKGGHQPCSIITPSFGSPPAGTAFLSYSFQLLQQGNC